MALRSLVRMLDAKDVLQSLCQPELLQRLLELTMSSSGAYQKTLALVLEKLLLFDRRAFEPSMTTSQLLVLLNCDSESVQVGGRCHWLAGRRGVRRQRLAVLWWPCSAACAFMVVQGRAAAMLVLLCTKESAAVDAIMQSEGVV